MGHVRVVAKLISSVTNKNDRISIRYGTTFWISSSEPRIH